MDGYTSTIDIERNHIHHFNTSTLEDSVEFRAYNKISPACFQEWHDTERFIFTDNHPDSTFAVKSIVGGLYGSLSFSINDEQNFDINLGNPLGISFDKERNDLIITTPFDYIVIKAKTDEDLHLRSSFRYDRKESTWQNYHDFFDLHDSLFVNFSVTGVNPYKAGHYVGINDSNFVLSTDYGKSIEVLSNHTIEEWELYNIRFGNTYFDADSSSFYITINSNIYLLRKESDAWSVKELSKGYSSFEFAPNKQKSGAFFFSHDDSLLYSDDFGNSTSFIDTFSHQITGLYKKPGSDILYVLTREELLEVNVETKATTSLKQIPVSRERLPDVPTQITLEQNYPNPFNPTTVISYQLTGNSLVHLEVFDVTGRKVATLVDGQRQTAGNQQVTFDASGLSSGVYFYRLETGGKTLTRKMLLVK
ncbi:T9SS type A sorting domain-containing protein [Gracilimonas mengyeensis]|nr:T9SS type A sorting domain-containing protein [Gracilimonas mengyeensis]